MTFPAYQSIMERKQNRMFNIISHQGNRNCKYFEIQPEGVAYTFNPSTEGIESGGFLNRNSRSVWATERSPGSQGYTEKCCVNKTNKGTKRTILKFYIIQVRMDWPLPRKDNRYSWCKCRGKGLVTH